MSDLRKNGQVVQPNVEYMPDDNGWPKPLTDPSDPYKVKVTNGKNGEQKDMDGEKTSQDSWSLTEGSSSGAASQPAGESGQRGSDYSTSQTIWSDPAGKKDGGATQPDIDGDTSVKNSDPLKTSQQGSDDHDKPEGD